MKNGIIALTLRGSRDLFCLPHQELCEAAVRAAFLPHRACSTHPRSLLSVQTLVSIPIDSHSLLRGIACCVRITRSSCTMFGRSFSSFRRTANLASCDALPLTWHLLVWAQLCIPLYASEDLCAPSDCCAERLFGDVGPDWTADGRSRCFSQHTGHVGCPCMPVRSVSVRLISQE